MKVLLAGVGIGNAGSGFSMMALAECLGEMGIEVVLACDTLQNGKNQNLKFRPIHVQSWTYYLNCSPIKRYCVGVAKNILNIKPYFQMLKIIKEENPDIVHINTASTYVGAVAALKCKKKLVWHIRELLEEDIGAQWTNPEGALRLMSKADCLVSISNCVYNKFHTLLPEVPNRVIYNGVDMERYKNDEHTIFGKSNTVLTIAGRIAPNKGQFEVLKGLTDILKTQQNAEFWIAGSEPKTGKELEKMKAYMSENQLSEKQVKFLGFVTDMAAVWAQTDVAVVASNCEAFGRVTVEAMAAGCLVLGANSGATPELITDGETGLLYQQGDSEDLGRKVEYILKHTSEMQKIAAKGREYAVTNFTAEKNAEKVKKLYENLINQG